MSGSGERSENRTSSYSTPEWVSLIISLAILAFIIGTVLWLWLSTPQNPAGFRVERGQTRMVSGLYYLDFTIINEGHETGSMVKVEGSIQADGRQERSSTTFDYVPGSSTEEGVLVFTTDPKDAVIRIVSYQKPS